MILVKPSFEILAATPDGLELIETAGRTCYKSEPAGEEKAHAFVRRIVSTGHHSVLEHMAVTVRFVCDRGVSHELVRHRLASYSQESTRYCNYAKGRFGGHCTFVIPPWYPELLPGAYGRNTHAVTGPAGEPMFPCDENPAAENWLHAMLDAESAYLANITLGESPQQARSVLPNALKTEIVMTANAREWMHVFRLRCAPDAHPQIRELLTPCRDEFGARWPAIFGEAK